MGFFGLLASVVALFFVGIALLPFLGWLNWFILPLSMLGFVLSMIGVVQKRLFALGVVGVILSGAALIIGIVRLTIGPGVF